MCNLLETVKSQVFPQYHNRVEEILSCLDNNTVEVKVTHSEDNFVAMLNANRYGENRVYTELHEMSGKLIRFPHLHIKGNFVAVLKVERSSLEPAPKKVLFIYEGREISC